MADKITLGQQRAFDQRLADFRRYYRELDAESRHLFREWLEKLVALWRESPLEVALKVDPLFDVTNKKGKVIRWADCEFCPSTMLQAIKAWDAGETLTPDTVLP